MSNTQSGAGRFILSIGVITLICSASSRLNATSSGQWPMLQHDPQHTGLSQFNTGANVGSLKWKFTTGQIPAASVAIANDGTVYLATNGSDFYALNSDGTPKWIFPTSGDIAAPAIAPDGTIYISSQANNTLYALNPNGIEKWPFTASCGMQIPTVGSDGTVYVTAQASDCGNGTATGTVISISPSGTQNWVFDTNGAATVAPAIGADGTVYATSHGGILYAINPNGTEKWQFDAGSTLGSSAPSIGSDGTIYFGSDSIGSLYAVTSNGTQKWQFTTGGPMISSPAIAADGTIYVGSLDNNVYAINPNGSQKWVFPANKPVASSAGIGADGTIYIGSSTGDNNLYAINPDGSLKWKFTGTNAMNSSPAIGLDGTVYEPSNDGNLYALGPGNPAPNCTQAVASAPTLWPPNGKFVQENVLGVTDSDGDVVKISITSIKQDEPVGNKCPDGIGIGSLSAQVRAERDGNGSGRVYRIGFTANDGYGNTCNGSVAVCVPHDHGNVSTCADNGQSFDSTVCP